MGAIKIESFRPRRPRSVPPDRPAGSSSPAGYGSSASGANARFCPGSSGGREPPRTWAIGRRDQSHPARDASTLFGGRQDPHRAGRTARRGQHRRALPARGDRPEPLLPNASLIRPAVAIRMVTGPRGGRFNSMFIIAHHRIWRPRIHQHHRFALFGLRDAARWRYMARRAGLCWAFEPSTGAYGAEQTIYPNR